MRGCEATEREERFPLHGRETFWNFMYENVIFLYIILYAIIRGLGYVKWYIYQSPTPPFLKISFTPISGGRVFTPSNSRKIFDFFLFL